MSAAVQSERPLAAYVSEPVLQPVLAIADVEQEVMRVTLKDTTVSDFFGALFSDTSNFQEKICKERGDDNFSCGVWTRTPTGFHTRTRRFESPYKTPFGELGRTAIVETQRAQIVAAEGAPGPHHPAAALAIGSAQRCLCAYMACRPSSLQRAAQQHAGAAGGATAAADGCRLCQLAAAPCCRFAPQTHCTATAPA